MVASFGDEKGGSGACAEPGWELVAEGGQGAGAAAAAGANRGDRDAGGTGTGTPLFKSLFPLRDPALATARGAGWERAWEARGRRDPRPRRV